MFFVSKILKKKFFQNFEDFQNNSSIGLNPKLGSNCVFLVSYDQINNILKFQD